MSESIQVIKPFRIFEIDKDYGGYWMVTGDLTGDGRADLVCGRNYCYQDRHWVVAVAAHTLDGEILWCWGEPGAGRRELHHDVAIQIYDWDGDGKNEVLLATEKELVMLDGATGREKRKLPLPDAYASDCIVVANLTGNKKPVDIIIKDRYWNIWAYDYDWKQLWHVNVPGGYRTAHQPIPIDMDGDGRDEVMAGYAMLNSDGKIRWILNMKQSQGNPEKGHLDCFRVLKHGGADPSKWRFVITYCGGFGLAVIDGLGNILRENLGQHFESIDIGRIDPSEEEMQIFIDVPNQFLILNKNLEIIAQKSENNNRHHTLVDWLGDGTVQPVAAGSGNIYNQHLEPICRLELPEPGKILHCNTPAINAGGRLIGGDMDGDGRPDITIITRDFHACVFRNENGRKVDDPPGTGVNYTLY